MSGVVKSAKKVFKKVGKAVKKVLPIALGVGAVVFTAGAALGVGSMAGGWGAAVGKLTSGIGMSGTLGNIVTGAVTQAGYGAAMGAATSAITGGDIGDGAFYGAAAGTATGGVSGALGWQTDPLANAFDGGNTAAEMAGPRITGQSARAMPPAQDASYAPGVEPTPASYGAGGFLEKGGWLERNQGLVGRGLVGVANGVMKGLAADGQAGASAAQTQNRADNYRTSRGLLTQTGATPGANGLPQVHEKYGPPVRDVRYVFNQETGRIEQQLV